MYSKDINQQYNPSHKNTRLRASVAMIERCQRRVLSPYLKRVSTCRPVSLSTVNSWTFSFTVHPSVCGGGHGALDEGSQV